MDRHETGEARVIPIILRPVYWKDTPFGKLQALPKNAMPVSSWLNQDEAFFDIATGIRNTVQEPLILILPRASQKTKKQWQDTGDIFFERKDYEEALIAYEQVIRLDRDDSVGYTHLANALCSLKHYEEALTAYKQAIRLDLSNASAYNGKGDALVGLKRYEEALAAFEQAIRLDPNNALAFTSKGAILKLLGRSNEAQQVSEKALQFDHRTPG